MKEKNYSGHARARTQQRAVPHGTGWRYSTYNQTLAGLQPLIEASTGLKNVRLVDAHSFCWIFSTLLKLESEGSIAKAAGEGRGTHSRRAREIHHRNAPFRREHGQECQRPSRSAHLKNKEQRMPAFARTIGIDYSGAETPTASLKGLRVYLADGDELRVEVPPPPSSRKYWTRKGIAEWLVERLTEDVPTLVGIDHGFSFPKRYFEVHGLLPDWPRLAHSALQRKHPAWAATPVILADSA